MLSQLSYIPRNRQDGIVLFWDPLVNHQLQSHRFITKRENGIGSALHASPQSHARKLHPLRCPAYPAAIYEKKKGFAPFALLRSKSREGTHLMRRSTATFGDCGRHDRFPSPLKTGKKLCPCVQPLPNSPAHHISPTPMQEASKIHAAVTLGYTRSKKGPEGPFGCVSENDAQKRGDRIRNRHPRRRHRPHHRAGWARHHRPDHP